MRTLYMLCVFLVFVSGVAIAQEDAPKSPRITPDVAWQQIRAGALLVDVRSPEEFAAGHLEGALNIPHDVIAARLAEFGQDKTKQIVLYCRSGRRSGIARDALIANGFTAVVNAGGYEDLKASNAH